MRDVEVVADWVSDLQQSLHEEIGTLSRAELTWQPDAEANNIAVTVWHMARWLDVITTRVLGAQAAEDEQWHTQGWTAQTGYDPRGIGYAGLGAITGYTQAEVAAVPILTAEELVAYVDQTCGLLRERLLALGEGGLYQPSPMSKSGRPAYLTIKTIIQGCFGHVGEIQALKAMRARVI